jgi:hypothetical protein
VRDARYRLDDDGGPGRRLECRDVVSGVTAGRRAAAWRLETLAKAACPLLDLQTPNPLRRLVTHCAQVARSDHRPVMRRAPASSRDDHVAAVRCRADKNLKNHRIVFRPCGAQCWGWRFLVALNPVLLALIP